MRDTTSDTRFWAATEKIELDFVADRDLARFRRRMKHIGHDSAVIEERIKDIEEMHRQPAGQLGG